MKTTIREGPDVSAIGGRRLENRNTDFSGFRDIDQRERTAVDQEITPHQSESALTAQRVNRRSTASGDAASGSGVLRKPSSEEALEKCVASAGRESGSYLPPIKGRYMRRCSPCLRISEDAEDVAQDALLKALAPFESVSQRVELRDLADSDSDQ